MPGQNPVPPPEEPAEARDERTATDNERRDALRRKLLDLQEAANAIRVHGLSDLTAEEAGAELVKFITEPAPADVKPKGE